MLVLKIIGAIMLIGTVLFTLFICFPIIRVEGDSMYPTLKEGKLLLCTRLFNKNKCKKDRLYIIYLKDDEDGEPYFIIKRLKDVRYSIYDYSVAYDFRGDNTEVSYDSRQHGLFNAKDVELKVLGRFKNKSGKEC